MNISDFSHVDEKEFLKGYAEFTVKIRPFIIKRLADQYRCATAIEEKDTLYVLALEQHFLLYEACERFFKAIKDRHTKSILGSLTEDLNIQNLYGSLNKKTPEDIIRELNISLSENNKKERFIEMIKIWKDHHNIFKATIPLFNKIKHKLLIYKKNKNERPILVLNKKQEEEIKRICEEGGIRKEESLPENISFLVDIAENHKEFILCLIKERLSELK